MALFTSKADAGLPLLTQFYQLDLPLSFDVDLEEGYDAIYWSEVLMESELRFWVDDTLAKWKRGRVAAGESHWASLTNTPVGWPDNHQNPKHRQMWAELARLQLLLQRLMDCAADVVAPASEDTERLNRWLAMLMPAPELVWIVTEFGQARRNHIYLASPNVMLWHMILHKRLVTEFLEALEGGRLRRCEECGSVGSVFVEQKPGQKYCSQRCRTRITSRRRYATLFSEYKPTRRRPESAKNTVQSQ